MFRTFDLYILILFHYIIIIKYTIIGVVNIGLTNEIELATPLLHARSK